MKFTQVEIIAMVNNQRRKEKLPDVQYSNLGYWRKKFAHIIDEVYAVTVLRIGEIYSTADKIVRISRYHELAQYFREAVIGDFEVNSVDDFTIKKSNVYVRILDRINSEMGDTPLNKMIRHTPKESFEDSKDVPLTKDEMQDLVKKELDQRYAAQLPSAIQEKIEFTDYFNCAHGEKLGEVINCWHSLACDNDKNGQCSVQTGKTKKCTKFLNHSLLNDKDWLQKQRENGISLLKIGGIVGVMEYDVECRDRIVQYLNKFKIYNASANLKNNSESEEKDEVEATKQIAEEENKFVDEEPVTVFVESDDLMALVNNNGKKTKH
jgi:hypothetical protein